MRHGGDEALRSSSCGCARGALTAVESGKAADKNDGVVERSGIGDDDEIVVADGRGERAVRRGMEAWRDCIALMCSK